MNGNKDKMLVDDGLWLKASYWKWTRIEVADKKRSIHKQQDPNHVIKSILAHHELKANSSHMKRY
jgi:hypothetical protein